MPRFRSPRNVFVIPCSAAKAAHPTVAAELYQGRIFAEALAAARTEVDDADILVLSARWGLLRLDEFVAPYDVKMGDAGSVTVGQVAAHVVRLGLVDADVYALVPRAYLAILDEALRVAGNWAGATDVYEATRGIGEQKHVNKVLVDRDADLAWAA